MIQPIIAGNWKMHKTPFESRELVQQLLVDCTNVKDRTVVLCPPFTSLHEVGAMIQNSQVRLGAQNMASEKSGAYTGEISGSFLKALGCTYVIIGHSERRNLFGENDSLINKKLKLALELELIPIFCVGETLDQREANKTFDIIRHQLTEGLKGLSWQPEKIVIAYEPVWAIGTGRTATPSQASEVHGFIRKTIKQEFGKNIENLAILYGGSVKPDNIDELMSQNEINGVLVGGASLKSVDFLRIIKFNK